MSYCGRCVLSWFPFSTTLYIMFYLKYVQIDIFMGKIAESRLIEFARVTFDIELLICISTFNCFSNSISINFASIMTLSFLFALSIQMIHNCDILAVDILSPRDDYAINWPRKVPIILKWVNWILCLCDGKAAILTHMVCFWSAY